MSNEQVEAAIVTPEPRATETPAKDPFQVLGVVGFILSFVAFLNIPGLVVSIIALVRSKRAGFRNGFAIAGTVIAGLGVLATIGVVIAVSPIFIDLFRTCAELGTGVHEVGSRTYECTPTSANVYWNR
ncbi:hypothetical protein ARHIZOSPH14_24160 [Agromyces rhizosphaerae]|uniref:DUF4190 domain-containing protein n=1 Tax=Agromyces rhizosphaerae TaxID=88374 RepID=A0A9W6CWP7_9MICO|nr:DUF4190 domain-containing protein [Agromyces rhizosphaerae]GLI28174.1 hypothetical protein ARHIZOSPH14_24160 [Agromyces rhizosphaerae]